MKSETKWAAVVVSGPKRQHLMTGIVPQDLKRDVWAECLKRYQKAWREDPNDPDDRAGYDRLTEDFASGRVRVVKVAISWENVR